MQHAFPCQNLSIQLHCKAALATSFCPCSLNLKSSLPKSLLLVTKACASRRSAACCSLYLCAPQRQSLTVSSPRMPRRHRDHHLALRCPPAGTALLTRPCPLQALCAGRAISLRLSSRRALYDEAPAGGTDGKWAAPPTPAGPPMPPAENKSTCFQFNPALPLPCPQLSAFPLAR